MNRTLFKYHTWMALIAALPLIVICLTGSILVFKHEIDRLLMPEKVSAISKVASGNSPTREDRINLDQLHASVKQQYPHYEPTGWAFFLDPGRADSVVVAEHGTSDKYYLIVNQYTGEVIAPPVTFDHYLTDWLLALHYHLLLSDAGLVITTLISIIFCALGITGVILYRKFWKNFFTLRWRRSLTVLFNDIHKMVGTLSAPVFLVLGFTGGYWNVMHLWHDLVEHAGEEPFVVEGTLYGEGVSLQALYNDTDARIDGFVPTYMSLPDELNHPIYFFGDVPQGNPLISQYGSFITYAEQDGHFLDASDIRQAGLARKVDDSFRRLHFGNFAGLWSKVFWCVIGIMPLVLSVTGIYVWYLRKQKRAEARAKRRRKNERKSRQPATA